MAQAKQGRRISRYGRNDLPATRGLAGTSRGGRIAGSVVVNDSEEPCDSEESCIEKGVSHL